MRSLFILVLMCSLAVCRQGTAVAGLVNNGNGTVTDNVTGLVWQQGEPGAMAWGAALAYCNGLTLGGHSDWRLPSVSELGSLTDEALYNPALDTSFFPNAVSSTYWSSTTRAYGPDHAWSVGFLYGNVGSDYKWYDANLVRCVRGGQGGLLDTLNVTADPPGPSVIGTTVTFTAAASGGSGSYQYQFWLKTPSGSWSIVQAYSATATWTWNTTGLPPGTYSVQVWARNEGSPESYEAFKIIDYTITGPPAGSVTLTPSLSSPRPVGTGITFTAAASGGSGSYQYQFWLKNPGRSWTIRQAYSTTPTWSWNTTGLPAGTYSVQVWAKNTGSSATYEAYSVATYTLTSPPAGSVTITPDKASPQKAGTGVTFTAAASGGSGSYQYQFWLCNTVGTWSSVRAYSSAPTWTWSTTGLPVGNYMVLVWARNSGSSASYEAYKTLDYTLTVSPAGSVTLTPDKVSPQKAGTVVTFNAAASGGSGSYQYQFWTKNPGGSWTIRQAYSTTPTLTWDTAGLAAGSFGVQVWARNSGSSTSYEAYAATTYTLTTSASSVTLSPDKAPPQKAGTNITFTAAASGGSGTYQYQFWTKNPGGSWTIRQAYSTTPAWTWSTTGLAAGTYSVQVWARNAGSTAAYEAYKNMDYTLTVPPAGSVTLTPDKASPQAAGTVITFTGAASGGSGLYQYQFWTKNPGGSWTIRQAYSATPTWTWDTTGLPTGSYSVQVWARNAGSTAAYEAYRSLNYILQ